MQPKDDTHIFVFWARGLVLQINILSMSLP